MRAGFARKAKIASETAPKPAGVLSGEGGRSSVKTQWPHPRREGLLDRRRGLRRPAQRAGARHRAVGPRRRAGHKRRPLLPRRTRRRLRRRTRQHRPAVPSQEVDPYRGLAPHLRIASARARALHAMATGQARVVVASASALLPRVSPPGSPHGPRPRPQARRRHRHATAGRNARGRGLHAPGPGRRAQATSASAGESSTFSPPATTCPPASSSSATQSRPSAATRQTRSGRW